MAPDRAARTALTTATGPVLGKVAVIGGGIAGLACAHHLGAQGAAVTLFESTEQLGGLGTHFEFEGRPMERFYHCMLPSDRHLLALLADLGLDTEVYWKETSFGFMHGGRIYPLNSAADLLRFAPLPLADRLRVGATGAWGRLRSADGLDDISCESWLTRLSGTHAFDTFWKPMLQAKFGDRYREVPALWFWTRFNREKGEKRERKGYLPGGYRRVADTLAASIRRQGGHIRLATPVSAIDLAPDGKPIVSAKGTTEPFDRLVFTGPITLLERLVKGGRLGDMVSFASAIDMQGVVNAVLLLRRPLSSHYWVAAIDGGIPFQGIVESTTLLEPQVTGGHHLVYLMNYLHRSNPRFHRDDDAILAEYLSGLRRLFPELRDGDIAGRFVFRSPYVEPLYTLGYLRRMPPITLHPSRVYLATTAQVYPEVTSWNGSAGLARRVSDRIVADATASTLRTGSHV